MKEILIYSDAESNHEPTDPINQLTEPLLEMVPLLITQPISLSEFDIYPAG